MFSSKMFLPDTKLNEWIKLYWFFKGNATEHSLHERKILPDGCATIVFVLDGTMNLSIYKESTLKRGIYIVPPVLKPHRDVISNHIHMIDVQLNPGIFYKLFKLPITALEERIYTFDEISIEFDEDILYKIEEVKDNDYKVYHLIDKFFLRLFEQKNFFADDIIYHLNELYKTGNLDKFFNEQKLSVRQLERKVKELTALTPKNLSRLGRFYSILEYIKFRQFNIAFSQVAFEHDYSDQSHFIRDFKAFAETTPNRFIKEINNYPQFKGLCNLTQTFDELCI